MWAAPAAESQPRVKRLVAVLAGYLLVYLTGSPHLSASPSMTHTRVMARLFCPHMFRIQSVILLT